MCVCWCNSRIVNCVQVNLTDNCRRLWIDWCAFSDSCLKFYFLHTSGPCNSFNCLGHFKHFYDDENECVGV